MQACSAEEENLPPHCERHSSLLTTDGLTFRRGRPLDTNQSRAQVPASLAFRRGHKRGTPIATPTSRVTAGATGRGQGRGASPD